MPPTVYIGIPAMDENQFLPHTLQCIKRQDYAGEIHTYVCVNQPDWWHNDPDHAELCRRNAETLKFLEGEQSVTAIDRSTPGNGWQSKKKSGVGMARQTILDQILHNAQDNDIFVSMDADCHFSEHYISAIVEKLKSAPKLSAINPPYYHCLTGDARTDRNILRYEIYMRTFMLNMLRIKSPFAFTAFGSAIACRTSTCRTLGNFGAQQAGEDFYFLQKIAKHGNILLYNEETVYPSARISHRVPFGTGQTVGETASSHPIFHPSFFDKVSDTYKIIDDLYQHDIHNELLDFIQADANESVWGQSRQNAATAEQFRKMFHQKCDGLRIFQFLRHLAQSTHYTDEKSLKDFFTASYPEFPFTDNFSFEHSPIETLTAIRDFLSETERKARFTHDSERKF